MTPRKSTRLYMLALCSGSLLSLSAFLPFWYIQLVALLGLAGLFVLLQKTPPSQSYVIGLAFFGSWVIPTTYWYYNFMPVWLACLASFGVVTLLANLFHLIWLRKKLGIVWLSLLFCLAWAAFTAIRIHVPILEDWWLPYLGYSVWQSSAFLWIGKIGGEASIELALLLMAAVLASVYSMRGKKVFLLALSLIACLVGMANVWLWRLPAKPISPVIAIQRMPEAGVDQPATKDDVIRLLHMADPNIEKTNKHSTVTVVLPENSVPQSAENLLTHFAQDRHVNIVYHSTEIAGDRTYKKVVLINNQGKRVLTNYKSHIAPDEKGTSKSSKTHVVLGDTIVTAYVCYDLHYPDIVHKIKGSDTAYVPLNDAAYGYLQKRFHAADISLRAAQANTTIVVASTNGPTMIVNSNGVVVDNLNSTSSEVLSHD